ncbi:DUF6126 family protein [Kitasatospora sp. NPDC002040]
MAKLTTDAGHRTDRRVLNRVLIYMVATHAFLGFLALLFALGSRN